MEKCRLIEKKVFTDNNERVYAGHISCPAFLDEWEWILESDCPLTLVLPPVRQRDTTKAKEVIKVLAQSGRKGLEFSVNDFGIIKYVAENFPELTLAAGPLLFSQDTDPVIFSFFEGKPEQKSVWYNGRPAVITYRPPSEACTSHWAEPAVFSNESFLKEMGVSRLEICRQPLVPAPAPDLPVTVYDLGILSVGPCTGNCEVCRLAWRSSNSLQENPSPFIRGGREIINERNLLYYSGGYVPPFADRIVSLCTDSRE